MNRSLKMPLVALFLLLASAASAFAANITGTVTDSVGEPMIDATLRLLRANDSTFVKGMTSDVKGAFRFEGVANGNYILSAKYIGYDDSFVNIKVSGSNVKLKPIVMKESSVVLKEMVVTGVKTEITVKEDTIEYNAGSFKTQPNAVMEDLFKKLPGVEVDNNGAITAGGKTVSKILVNGKEFFADDPKVASKNLPVDIVEKVQVVDRKSDFARMTGVDDGEEETVINLTIKKGMNNGFVGVVNAGYGTDDRYAADFNINRFWNANQMTLLGNFNNINQLGFTDSNGNRFSRFGGGNGITKSQSVGLNFNVGREDETLRVGGNVLYSHTDQLTVKRQERQYIFTDSTSYVSSRSRNNDRGNNLRGDFRMKWEIDSCNSIEFRPNFSLNFNKSVSSDSSLTRAGNRDMSPVTRSLNDGNSDGHSFETSAEFWYSHKFRSRPGRSFAVRAQYSFNNVREDINSYSWNSFYLLDSLDIYDQYADNHKWSNRVGGRLTWTEPIGELKRGLFLEFSYNISYRWNNSDKLTYDHPVIILPDGTYWIDYDELVMREDISNSFRNDFFQQRIQAGFRMVKQKYNLNVGMNFNPSMSKSHDLINSARDIAERWVWNYSPYLRFRYRFSKTRSLQANYRGRTSEPSMSQLQPVADVSNPLRVVIGNPDLDPSFTHNLEFRFNDFNMESQRSYMFNLNLSMVQNNIVSKTTFDSSTGGQVTTYVNVNGNWNGNLFAMYSAPFRNKAWQLSGHLFTRYRQSIAFNNGRRNRSNNISLNPNVSLSWRPDYFDITLRPNLSYSTTHNTVNKNSNNEVTRYGFNFRTAWFSPFGLTLDSTLDYSASTGMAAGYDQKQWMWNASIAYQFLRGRAATVTLRAYDLLHQRSSISRNVTANYIDDTEYNTLTRYFMLTFSYRFNTFGKGGQPSDRNMPGGFRGGPGGPGGPGGRGGRR